MKRIASAAGRWPAFSLLAGAGCKSSGARGRPDPAALRRGVARPGQGAAGQGEVRQGPPLLHPRLRGGAQLGDRPRGPAARRRHLLPPGRQRQLHPGRGQVPRLPEPLPHQRPVGLRAVPDRQQPGQADGEAGPRPERHPQGAGGLPGPDPPLSDERVRRRRPQTQMQAVLANLAEHEFTIGRFYSRFGAPLAAVERYEYLLQHLPAVQGAGQGDVQPRARLRGRATSPTTPSRPSTCCAQQFPQSPYVHADPRRQARPPRRRSPPRPPPRGSRSPGGR